MMDDGEIIEIQAEVDDDWKRELKDSLNAMVDALPAELPSAQASSDAEPPGPTLEEFYRTLIALEANTRKNVQKTNAALDSVAKALRGLQIQLTTMDERIAANADNDHEAIINLNGQFLRMLESLQSPPATIPLGLSRKWEKAWADLTGGVAIIQRSIINILNEHGIRIESPAIGSPFDPHTMEAIKVTSSEDDRADATVVAVIEPAYYQNDLPIRNARVHVKK
jgi:molecular chaperone GrpE (heat shock protein)